MNYSNVNQKKFSLALLVSVVSIVLLVVLCIIFGKTFTKQQNYREVISNVNTKNLLKNLVSDDICYVIGHKSPDTDTVCSAILVADYLKLNGINCEARVSGKLNNETNLFLIIMV